jgi:ribosomal protein L12E/L44/L45/RPP1/RPP2
VCRLLADAEFFQSRISKIDGSADLGEQIVKVVQAKSVANTVTPSPAPAAVSRASGQDAETHEEESSTEIKGHIKEEESNT